MRNERSSALLAATVLRVEAAGVRVRLEFGAGLGEVAEEIRTIWRHLLVEAVDEASGEDEAVLAYAAVEEADALGGPVPSRSAALRLGTDEGAGYQVSGDITREVIRRLIGRAILLHAGIVDHPTLGVVALVGPSGAGKSTAVAHLSRDGRYVTDELAILDPEDFTVSPYPKPISLRDQPERSRRGRKVDRGPAEMDLEPARTCSPPQMLVLLDRIRSGAEPGHEQDGIGVERVPLQSALPALIAQSSSLSEVPGGLARLTELAVRTGGAVRVRYRDAEQLVGLLGRLPAPEHEEWEAVSPAPSSARDSAEARERPHRPGALRIDPSGQAVVAESGVVVLCGSESFSLEGLTALVWDELRAAQEATPEDLVERIVAVLGPHPQSADLVDDALERLRESRLVITRG